ncbi:mesothelin-like protein [Oryzias latipes]|uniref:mesothelin-like protein n=1 Tax=Oryzias latipes TaxID=8090 RepID=UPI000CE281E3|nr:mesothelin-like protein [Oryzias latipes]
MYNQIKEESDATSFSLYPPDVLLYYDYSLVPRSSCRSYFQELADADFSIFSSALTYRRSSLFNNARNCLGITSTSLTEDNVSVLGNMCCILDGSYIQNSHPSILEQLKNCPDLTVGQSTAVITLLTNGNTPYGDPSTWSEQTLKDLGMLTLHLTSSFYQRFDQDTKRNFLKYFLKVFGRVSREQRKQLKKEIRQSIKSDSDQTAECTVGIITQVTISDPTFPFDYNINQFNNCLSVSTVKDNLDGITEKVDEVEYLRIVLQKLQEADNSIIPEDQVQLLGAASRVATVHDILSWTISKIDTLAALMDSSNGGWDPNVAKVIISKYLAVGGNKLSSAELNVIGGPNLCSLDVDVIRTISSQNFREVDSLDISSCTTDKKKEFFTISFEAFNLTTSSVSVFQLIQPYIGGANVNYIRSLVVSGVNMDLATFTSLDEKVVLSLTASEVKGLLGTSLPDLKSYENQTLVQTWIRSQYQSELDILGLDLQGGKVDPSIPPYYSSTTLSTPTILSEMTILTTTGDFKGQCRGITANESNTCVGVNSTDLQVFLNSGKMSKRFCNFSVEEFACASLSALTAQDLVEIMKCDLSSNSSGSISAWNLLFCKTSGILNAALNLLTTATINPNNPAVSVILDSIQAISPDLFSTNTLNNLTELQLWFNVRLRPFLPAVSTNFLSILATKDLQCNSYQYM